MAASMRRASLCQVKIANICSKISQRHVSSGGKVFLNKLSGSYRPLLHSQSSGNGLTTLNRHFENRLHRLCIRSCSSSSSTGDEGSPPDNQASNDKLDSTNKDELDVKPENPSETTVASTEAIDTDKVTQMNSSENETVEAQNVSASTSSSSNVELENKNVHIESIEEKQIEQESIVETTEDFGKESTEGAERLDSLADSSSDTTLELKQAVDTDKDTQMNSSENGIDKEHEFSASSLASTEELENQSVPIETTEDIPIEQEIIAATTEVFEKESTEGAEIYTERLDSLAENLSDTTSEFKQALDTATDTQMNSSENENIEAHEVSTPSLASTEELEDPNVPIEKTEDIPIEQEIVAATTEEFGKESTEGAEKYTESLDSSAESIEVKDVVQRKKGKKKGKKVLLSTDVDKNKISTSEKEEKVEKVDFENDIDVLYRQIDLTMKGHDKEVLKSYQIFLQMAAKGLDVTLESHPMSKPKIHRMSILKSVHIFKKHFRQYERRTYFLKCSVHKVTGSTASVYLEYIQRNLPEGVAMEVTKYQVAMIPEHLKPSIPTEQVEDQKQIQIE